MKNLLSALLVLVLVGCQKENEAPVATFKPVGVIESDHELFGPLSTTKRAKTTTLEEASRKGGIKVGPNRPPKDTVITNPPTTGRTNVVYLNFKGGVDSSGYWGTGRVEYTYSGMTEAEIDSTCAKVYREFSPRGFIVTTDPSLYNLAPVNHKIQVNFTESWSWYCGTNPCAGGVAFVNSYSWTMPVKPSAWVFSSLLGYGSHNNYHAAVHEVGHTLGLRHVPGPNGEAYCWCQNYMGNSRGFERGIFETIVLDLFGNTINQVSIINGNL